MKKLIFLFIVLTYAPFLWATDCTLNGSVLFGTSETPVGNYTVELAFFEQQLFFTDTTDANGGFLFEFELDFDGNNPIFGLVSVTDFCTGIVLVEPVIFLANFPVAEDLEVVVCSDSNPPPPPLACDAFFQYQQADVDPYIVFFFDLSSTSIPIDNWLWDFGDGASSTLQNPAYEYEAPGAYEVSLTIQSDTCESTFTSIVTISDSVACNCNGIFDPVCVIGVEGDTIPFLNSCFAECEGYTEGQYFSCINACEADFAATPTDIPGQFQFQDLSESVGGVINEWLWDFGDGGSSTEQNPVHTFSEAGMASVSLQIATSMNCYSNLNMQVLVSTVSSTTDISFNEEAISVYPNPANAFLNIQLDAPTLWDEDMLIQISGVDGAARQVPSPSIASGEQLVQIDVSGLPAGIYLMSIDIAGRTFTRRFVKY
jgi:PKD repeat protein